MDLLRWRRQWGGQEKVWKLKVDRGGEWPPEYYTKPELDPGLIWLHEAFSDLGTERQIGMSIGPIPRSKIKQYGREELDLEGDALDNFITTMAILDSEYLTMVSAPHPAEQVVTQKSATATRKKRGPVNPLSANRKDR